MGRRLGSFEIERMSWRVPRSRFGLGEDGCIQSVRAPRQSGFNDIGCTADLDCDGSLTIFDQQAFGNAFDASDPVADWDGDGSFTIFDYNEFGNTYGLGCP